MKMGSTRTTRIFEEGARRALLLLLLILSTVASAQITVTNSSFSNGKATGTDGVNTVTSRVGAFGSLSNVTVVAAPTVPASSITFSNVLSTSMTVSFTPGNGKHRLAVMRAGSAPNFTPSNDTFYAGDLGNGVSVVYSGSGTSFDLSQLQPVTQYFITVFEFNEDGSSIKYLVTGAPTASQITLSLPLVYVTNPANGSVGANASLNVTSKAVTGATVYTIEISNNPTFTQAKVRTGARTQSFDSLQYNTLYFTRVKTDLRDDYGQVTTFSTRTAESLAFVTSPANNAVTVNTTVNITSSNVLYASQYTIQLSESPGFDTVAFEVTGPTRTLAFTGLEYNTLYYNRVLTNLASTYGAVRSFTTRTAESLAYVTTPANNAVNVNTSLNITSRSVPGAASYTIQLSKTADFDTIAFEVTGPTRTLAFSGLKYNTTYYNRVSTDLSPEFGLVNSFTTRTAESIAYVTSPVNGAIDRNTSLNISSNNVPGATSYTIQLSETPGFDTVAFEVTGPTRTLAFAGLNYNTTYYDRVLTNLASVYGEVRSFTTRTAESLAYVTTPANGAVNVSVNLNVTSHEVPGAATYTIQLSSAADFSSIDFQSSGASRTRSFNGLITGTTYYNRVLTNLTSQFGQIRSFTTAGVPPGGRLRAPEPLAEAETLSLKEFEVQVSPNPFVERLTVYVESTDKEAVLTLIDMTGRSVHHSQEMTNTTVEIDKAISAGVYLLKVRTANYVKVVRVVKIE